MIRTILGAIYIVLCVATLSESGDFSYQVEGGFAVNNDMKLNNAETRRQAFRGDGTLDYDGNTRGTAGVMTQYHFNDFGKSGWRTGFQGEYFHMSADDSDLRLDKITLEGWTAQVRAGYDHYFGDWFVGGDGAAGLTLYQPTYRYRGQQEGTFSPTSDWVPVATAGIQVGRKVTDKIEAFIRAEYQQPLKDPVLNSGKDEIQGLHRQQIKFGIRW